RICEVYLFECCKNFQLLSKKRKNPSWFRCRCENFVLCLFFSLSLTLSLLNSISHYPPTDCHLEWREIKKDLCQNSPPQSRFQRFRGNDRSWSCRNHTRSRRSCLGKRKIEQ